MEKIVYLGRMDWNSAIDKALSIGMFVPNFQLMNDILEIPELSEFKSKQIEQIISSTTYGWNTAKFVHPVPDNLYGKTDELEGVSGCPKEFEDEHTSLKNEQCHAFAVSKGLQKHHIKLGLYTFENSAKA